LPALLYESGMTNYTFLYRCPTTGHKVQGIVSDKPPAPCEASTYETVKCAACARVFRKALTRLES